MEKVNAVNWFEIPVSDMGRARKFYENMLNVKMTELPAMGDETEMVSFPWEQGAPFASGALVKNPQMEPSASGTTVYFHCEDLSNELGRVEENGGKIVIPKTSIGEHGFFAQFIDTEGNKAALHSLK